VPELPEVETIIRTLRPRILGHRILAFERLAPRACAADLASAITGQVIRDVSRHGKYILIDLDCGRLAIHLRMTGKLLTGGTPTHPRAVITTSGPAIVFDDIRQFGSIAWLEPDCLPPNLGPDVLALSAAGFAAIITSRSGAIKPLLLNQALMAGLGNIYVDEALFRARIHPRTAVRRVSRARLLSLHAVTVELLHEAIAAGGSSISDYVDSTGARGTFQDKHRVYGREGLPCPACSTPIRRIVVAQRGTHFCPRCQRA
jgi:formamidopyrimidine-DNA glycosylase